MAGKFNPIAYVKTAYKNSPWVVISVAGHALLFAILGAMVISQHLVNQDDQVSSITVAPKIDLPPENVVLPPEPIDLKAVPKNEDAELVSYEEDIYVPVTEQQPEEDLYLDRGDPTGIDNLPPGATGGTSIGVGIAGGHYGTGSPSAFAGRRAGGRGGKGRAGGATQGTEKAVLEGLRWLVRHQNEDGSWGGEEFRQRCTEGKPCVPAEHELTPKAKEGLTGLALLCFLGAGLNHDSKQTVVDTAMGKKYRMGDVVTKGLKFLKDCQREDGGFAANPGLLYNDILATMALTEAYGLSRNRAWKGPAEKGVAFIVAAQKKHPELGTLWGWRYWGQQEIDARKAAGTMSDADHWMESKNADISVTCWAVMALKSAELSGIEVPHEAYEGAMAFTEWVSKPDGLVGYTTPEIAGQAIGGPGDHFKYHVGTMSALSMLVRTFSRKSLDDPFLEEAAKHIVKDLPEISKDKLTVDYYYWYYASMALNQFDGPDSPRKNSKYWGPWNESMKEAVLALQDASKDRDLCARGGWLVDDRWSHGVGAIYNTAINTLTLEVYYRFENAFGGGSRGTDSAPVQAKPSESAQSESNGE
jgi:hypothetical protein